MRGSRLSKNWRRLWTKGYVAMVESSYDGVNSPATPQGKECGVVFQAGTPLMKWGSHWRSIPHERVLGDTGDISCLLCRLVCPEYLEGLPFGQYALFLARFRLQAVRKCRAHGLWPLHNKSPSPNRLNPKSR